MATPDLTSFVDLRIYDKDAQEVFDYALELLKISLPEWEPQEGNTEVLLLEAMAQQVAEAIFAINRLPGAVTQILLRLYGIERDDGDPPRATVVFNLADSLGHDIPAGTRLRLDLPGGLDPVVFLTDTALSVAPGDNSGTVTVTANRNTVDANGTIIGTRLELLDAIAYVNTVDTTTVVASGTDQETDEAWYTRGVQRFDRLSETLVVPSHFVSAALERPEVKRAFTLDNYSPAGLTTPTGVGATPSGTGGTLSAATYSYRVSAVNSYGETLASAAVTAITSGVTSKVTVAWSPVVPLDGADPVTNYKVYGRTGGTELLMATVSAATFTWDDTGAVSPSGALPVANTTVGPVGDFPGHVTVAVYGDGAPLSSPQKAAIEADFETKALANLDIHVIDPTITAVNINVTVVKVASYEDATVEANITARLAEYLDPANWEWGGTVYRNELIAIIDQVEGVARVTTITTPASDFALNGVAPLADLGTISVTVT